MRLVFLGPPGVGKGTQADKAAAERGVPHISTGDMFRAAMSDGSELGCRVKEYVDSGRLVPDDVTAEVVARRLEADECRGGFLLDGFPRTVAQAEDLESVLSGQGAKLDAVVYLTAADEVIMKRLMGRGRPDDTPETIRERLSVYRAQTEPLVALYREQGTLREVDGGGDIETVRSAVEAAIEAAE